MASYTTWQKVVDLFPLAANVESDTGNQTTLITDKSNLFQTFIRGIHKEDLTSPYDEPVKMAVAYLVIDELKKRRISDDSELEFVQFDHIAGKFTDAGVMAHSIIQGVVKGSIVLSQDDTVSDSQSPHTIPGSSNTSAGKTKALLPHEYKSNTVDTFLIKITTAGRVDAETAVFSWYLNNNATAIGTGVKCTTTPIHLRNELYVYFQDAALTGEQFAIDDTWTITAIPPLAQTRTQSPYNFEVFSG